MKFRVASKSKHFKRCILSVQFSLSFYLNYIINNRMFSLWNLFEAALLCLNAVCVLHEERFMQKMGWGANSQTHGFGDQSTIKFQILNLVRSIRTVTRIPLIFLNIITIVFKLILG